VAASSGRPNPWLTITKLIGALVATGVLAAGLVLPYVGGIGLVAKNQADKFLNTTCNLKESPPPEPTTIYARDGKTVLARIFTQDRDPVPLSDIPMFLQKALIDTEDRRFYEHHGVDLRGLIRSAFSTSGGDTQGGSTLTMQYVKQVRYYNDIGNLTAQQNDISQTLNRKMEDAQCAIQLEKRERKPTILDNYFNIAFFGENAYSIEAAAQTYFGVPVSKVTVPQAAMLVGLLQAPSQYDPFYYRDAATQRRNEVLQNMVTNGDLSQAEADTYAATPISLASTKPPVVQQGCANASSTIQNSGFFCDYVVTWLENVDGITDTQLNTGGLSIVTTLDPGLQNSTQANLVKAIPSAAAMTAVLPVVDPKTGDVLAMASNKLYGNPTSTKDTTHTMLANFTSATAFGASTYKLFSLLTALKTGVPSDWELDTYGLAGAATQTYIPANCYNYPANKPIRNGDAQIAYTRNETLATGTAKSSNTFYVGMDDQLFDCNLAPIVSMAESLGMTNLTAIDPNGNGKTTVGQDIVNNSSIVPITLGSGLGTSPLTLTGAYAAVANGGVYNTPAPILSVKDGNGNALAVKRTPPVTVLQPQVAAQAVQILQADTDSSIGTSYGTFQSWYSSGSSIVAGKTGTAVDNSGNKNSALWFVGMTPSAVATAAVINPAAPSNPIPSLPGVVDPADNAYGDYASALWLKALQPSLGTQRWSWPNPDGLSGLVQVQNVTGQPIATATATLKAQGFTVAELDPTVSCASQVPTGSVAFYGPQAAAPGTTITICPSSGTAQSVYIRPTPTLHPTPTHPASGNAGSGSVSAGGSGSASTGRTVNPPRPTRTNGPVPPN
jgi:membrane peptidoglycan carboxypeptidase